MLLVNSDTNPTVGVEFGKRFLQVDEDLVKL